MYFLVFKPSYRVLGYSEDYYSVWDLFCRWVEDGHSENDFLILKDIKIFDPFSQGVDEDADVFVV